MKIRLKLVLITFVFTLFFSYFINLTATKKSEPTVIKRHPWQMHLSQMPHEEKSNVVDYLKVMLGKSEAGYVLFGIKPVCLEAIEHPNPPERNLCFGYHCRLTLKEHGEAIKTWLNLQALARNPQVITVCYDQPDPPYQVPHSVWIHRTAFINAVNQNLPLFQYILGPQVHAELLYNTICDPNASFSSTLAHNKVLIGIVLGFGTQNALYDSRSEIIDIALNQQERPPYSTRSLRAGFPSARTIGNNRPLGSGMPISFGISVSDGEIKPSLGYPDLYKEQASLQEKIQFSTKIIDCSSPSIPSFSCLKDNKETDAILATYAAVQPKIQALLSLDDDTFLETVITHLLGDNVRALTPKIALAPSPTPQNIDASTIKNARSSQQLADYIGQIIWNALIEHEPDYVAAFISGMQTADSTSTEPASFMEKHTADLARIQPIRDSIFATRVHDAWRNIEDGNKFFKSLSEEDNIHELVPMKLYYRTITSGQGLGLTVNDDRVTIEYTINPLTGKNTRFPVASSVWFQPKMSEIIPGLAHGMLGMQPGEIREIFIHSDFGYGCHANFEPGLALVATVRLIQATNERSFQFPKLVAVDRGLEDVAPRLDNSSLKQLYQKAGYAEGYTAWQFYRLGNDLYSLQEVMKSIQRRSTKGNEVDVMINDDPILDGLIPLLYQRLHHPSAT